MRNDKAIRPGSIIRIGNLWDSVTEVNGLDIRTEGGTLCTQGSVEEVADPRVGDTVQWDDFEGEQAEGVVKKVWAAGSVSIEMPPKGTTVRRTTIHKLRVVKRAEQPGGPVDLNAVQENAIVRYEGPPEDGLNGWQVIRTVQGRQARTSKMDTLYLDCIQEVLHIRVGDEVEWTMRTAGHLRGNGKVTGVERFTGIIKLDNGLGCEVSELRKRRKASNAPGPNTMEAFQRELQNMLSAKGEEMMSRLLKGKPTEESSEPSTPSHYGSW